MNWRCSFCGHTTPFDQKLRKTLPSHTIIAGRPTSHSHLCGGAKGAGGPSLRIKKGTWRTRTVLNGFALNFFSGKHMFFERPFLVNGKIDSWFNIQLLSERCHNTRWPVGWQATRGWELKEWFFPNRYVGVEPSKKPSELNFGWSSFTSSLGNHDQNHQKLDLFWGLLWKSSESRFVLEVWHFRLEVWLYFKRHCLLQITR